MAIKNRMIFWSVLAVLLVAALTYAFWPRAIPADFAHVTRGPLSVTIDEEGETRVKDMFIVSAPVSGELERITLEPGDHVMENETIIASINPTAPPVLDQRTEAQLRAAVGSAHAAISVAESDLERLLANYRLAKAESERGQLLFDKDVISKAALDRLNAETDTINAAVHAGEAALRMRRSELQMARSALMPSMSTSANSGHVHVTPIVDGLVLKVIRESAGPVIQGAPLVEIGDPLEIEIVVDLLSEDAVAVSPGDQVIISGWGGDPLQGQVRIVEPYAFTKISALGIEEQRVNVIIDLEDMKAASNRLGHGYRVDIAVVVWFDDDVLSVPMTALFKQGSDWSTYVMREGRASLQILELGRMNGQRAQVLKGLSENDLVIEHPSNRIGEGVRVKDRQH